MRSGAFPNSGVTGLPARAAGYLGVAVLRMLRHVPPGILQPSLAWALEAYPRFRPAHARRLRNSIAASPHHEKFDLRDYYRSRLRLLLRGLRQHGRPLDLGAITVIGAEHYREALGVGGPVALLGLHSGVLELLHRVPEAPPGRPFLILTAPGFAPALTAFMAKGRTRDGKDVFWNGPIDSAESRGLGFAAGLRSALKSNGVLALMADQVPGPKSEAETLVLWDSLEVAYPARLLGYLARKGFRFVPVSTSLESDGTSAFRFHPAWDPAEVSDAASMRRSVREFLEGGIAAAPMQWNWSYPKNQPVRKRINSAGWEVPHPKPKRTSPSGN